MTITETLLSTLPASPTANTTSYTSVHVADPASAADQIILVYLVTTGGQVDPSSVTGYGLTFTQIAAINSGSTIREMLYAADATTISSAATEVVVSYAASQTGQVILSKLFTGVDVSGGIAVGAGKPIVQAPTGTGTSGTGSITMAAYSATGNREAAAFIHSANEGNTAEAGWTMEASASGNYNTPATSMGFEHKLDAQDTSPTMTWTTTTNAWRGIAVELNEKVAGGTQGSYTAVIGLTGTVARAMQPRLDIGLASTLAVARASLVARTIALSATLTVAALKAISRAIALGATYAVVVTSLKIKVLAIAIGATLTVATAKQARHIIAMGVTFGVAVTKQASHVIAVASTLTVAAVRSVRKAAALAATLTVAVTSSKVVTLAVSITATFTVGLVRLVARTIGHALSLGVGISTQVTPGGGPVVEPLTITREGTKAGGGATGSPLRVTRSGVLAGGAPSGSVDVVTRQGP